MSTTFDTIAAVGQFDLPAGALCSIDPFPGRTIECVAGQLWITQANDARDVVLTPGDTHLPNRRGRIVVQAIGDSTFQVK